MLLTLSLIKLQLKMEKDDDSEDELLTLYAKAAEKAAAAATNRKLYATAAEVPLGTSWALALDEHDDVQVAILLLLTHYYQNRGATTVENIRQLPLGVRSLLSPYVITAPELPEVTP